MNDYLTGVYLALPFVVAALIYFIIPAFLNSLAERNLFVTKVREGTAKAIVRYGEFERMVITYQGYKLDTRGYVRSIKDGEDEGKTAKDFGTYKKGTREPEEYTIEFSEEESFRWGGLVWIGLPFIHSVKEYEFSWASFGQGQEGGKLVPKVTIHDHELLDYILLQDDVYYVVIRDAETLDLITVDAELLVTARIVHPYRALFRVQNWLEATLNVILPIFRRYIAGKPFDVLQREAEESQQEIGTLHREDDNILGPTGVADYIERVYGARAKRVMMTSINPSGKHAEKFSEGAAQKWLAEQEAKKILTLADAEKKRTETVYAAIQKFGDVGIFVKAMETAKAAGEGPSNLVIFPFGAAKELLRGWTGGKTAESGVAPGNSETGSGKEEKP